MTIFQTTKMVYLEIPNNKSIKYYQIVLIRYSIAFKLLNILFNKPDIDREAVAKDLGVSQSTFYRAIEQYNQELFKNFNIKLLTTPFKLIVENRISVLFMRSSSLLLINNFPIETDYLNLVVMIDKVMDRHNSELANS